MRHHTRLICIHCLQPVRWSNFLDTHWCADCRCDEVREADDEPDPDHGREDAPTPEPQPKDPHNV